MVAECRNHVKISYCGVMLAIGESEARVWPNQFRSYVFCPLRIIKPGVMTRLSEIGLD